MDCGPITYILPPAPAIFNLNSGTRTITMLNSLLTEADAPNPGINDQNILMKAYYTRWQTEYAGSYL